MWYSCELLVYFFVIFYATMKVLHRKWLHHFSPWRRSYSFKI